MRARVEKRSVLGWNKSKIKLRRNTTLESSDIREFKMAIFENGEPEELFMFQHNQQMTLKAPGNITTGKKVQYLCT